MSETATETEIVWRGSEALRPFLVPIGDLKPHPRNPRRHNIDSIVASLREFGQQRPVLALPDGTLVAGHGTTESATALGWTHVAVVRSELAEADVERYLLADNRTSDLGYYEMTLLDEILTEQMERGTLEGTGYSADDVDDLKAELGRIAEAERQATEASYSETAEQQREREELRQSGAVMREVVLMLSPEQMEKFEVAVRILRKELEVEGVIETVYQAVIRAAQNPEALRS